MDIEPSLSQEERFPEMGKGNRADALGVVAGCEPSS
jgi:hypothetical protein